LVQDLGKWIDRWSPAGFTVLMYDDTDTGDSKPGIVTATNRRLRGSRSRTNQQLLLVIGISILAALVVFATLAYFVDPSPLADLPEHIAVERNVSYGTDDYQMLDIAYEHDTSRLHPAIVMIHQGGWMQGDKSSYHGLMARYAQLGYVTVSINFRPSGKARFPAAIEDCKLAIRWLRVHAATYGVDPNRIGVTGWSSGAHLAMLLALSDDESGEDEPYQGVSSRVQAAVCVSGVYDLLMQEQGQFPNREDDAAVVRFLGGTARQRPELAKQASPINYLSTDDPPLLVFHGELDRRIDAEQARQFALALEALGRTDAVQLLPNAGHGNDVLPSDPHSQQLIREFFAKHLQ
jgi:acetyl esterase/lipase